MSNWRRRKRTSGETLLEAIENSLLTLPAKGTLLLEKRITSGDVISTCDFAVYIWKKEVVGDSGGTINFESVC